VKFFGLIVICLLLLAGCSDGENVGKDKAAAELAGEPVIKAIDNVTGEVTLALTRSHVSMRLSEDTLEEINREFEDARREESDSRVVNKIKNTFLDRVERMLSTQVRYPIESIDRITWDDGEMVFILDSGHEAWDTIWVGSDTVLETFDEDDALEFIEAFEEVKNPGN
jgi:hypothetical protein